jgi:F0F1-type ATP synthase gamma subunit
MNQEEWINNAIHSRCKIAMEEIISAEVQRKLAAGEAITGSKDDIVLSANIETAAERQSRIDTEIQEQLKTEA